MGGVVTTGTIPGIDPFGFTASQVVMPLTGDVRLGGWEQELETRDLAPLVGYPLSGAGSSRGLS